ncbi:Nudix hydrolase 15 mitochondrial [Quillaja saponaria]|uniref:Nudix hydrolase 15 mitochondrial n=1 Tax=Quillaja saponaria TaxID=32244 RepID=A0AAD7L3R7_QUISA|nr:Nudix hydrolase 15 mitochondrial [Quillaja saponaria]
MTCIEVSPCLKNEDSESHTLQWLAKQLQFYKPPMVIDDDDEENSDDNSKTGSHLGLMEVQNDRQLSCGNWKERRAAVLICLFEGSETELRVILTKRSMKLSSHPGDVALPGGKMEEKDVDDSATALREAMEEIGLEPGLVQVVANLEPVITQCLLKVVPVVGLLERREDFKPVINTDEVDAIFDVPLEIFLKEDKHRCEEREWMGWKYMLHLFDYETEQGDFLIWGLTASILIRAASVIYRRSPSFPGHLPDFQQLQREMKNPA